MAKFNRKQLLHMAIVMMTDESLVAEFQREYGMEASIKLADLLVNLQELDNFKLIDLYYHLYEDLKEELENESAGS